MLPVPSAPQPLAFASLPWQLVMAIIVFNIVAGMISKRKQKQAKPGAKADPQADARKGEALRDKEKDEANRRNRELQRSAEETRLREAAEAKRKAAERRAREEMLRARVEARRSREAAAAEAPAGGASDAAASGAAAQARPETAKTGGRGLLDQLARELGLELPDASRPVPTTPRPPSKPTPAQPARPQGARSRGDAREEDADDLPGLASRTAPVAATVPPVPASAAQAAGPVDFSDPEAMRKAFILKTLLDKPLALRPHR